MRDPDCLIIDRSPGEIRIAALADGTLTDFWVDRVGSASRRAGEIAIARVTAVRPELNACFVGFDHGEAFLKLGKKPPPPEGALIPITVTADAAGRKLPQATLQVTLAGRFISLRPKEPEFAIDATLKARGKRKQLKELLQPLLLPGIGLHVSANAAKAEAIELIADVTALLTEWKSVEDSLAVGDGPKVLRAAPSLDNRITRAFPAATRIDSVNGSVFVEEDLDGQIDRALARRLQLSNGIALTFDEMEALVAIDVDIAGADGGPKAWPQLFESTTEYIADEIRLRRLSGLVLIDFPKFLEKEDRNRVAKAMQAAFMKWPTLMQEQPPQVLGWTRSGVLEITVTRIGQSLRDDMMRPVEQHPRAATIALDSLRRLLRETKGIAQPEMICARDVADWLQGPGRQAFEETKDRLGGFLKLTPDLEFGLDQIEIGPTPR